VLCTRSSSVVGQATKGSDKAAGTGCGVLLACLAFQICLLVGFGGFGAKLVKFKSSTLYDLFAMKLLATMHYTFPFFLIAPSWPALLSRMPCRRLSVARTTSRSR
jgi:hypothetical protein